MTMRGGGLLSRSNATLLCACCRRRLPPCPSRARQLRLNSTALPGAPENARPPADEAASPARPAPQWPAQSGWGAFGSVTTPKSSENGSYDDLLPHEQAARERAGKPAQAPPKRSSTLSDDVLPHELAARDRARQTAQSRAPAQNGNALQTGASGPRANSGYRELKLDFGGEGVSARPPRPSFDSPRPSLRDNQRPDFPTNAREHEGSRRGPPQRGPGRPWQNQQSHQHAPRPFGVGAPSARASEQKAFGRTAEAETAPDSGNLEWGQLTRRRYDHRPSQGPPRPFYRPQPSENNANGARNDDQSRPVQHGAATSKGSGFWAQGKERFPPAQTAPEVASSSEDAWAAFEESVAKREASKVAARQVNGHPERSRAQEPAGKRQPERRGMDMSQSNYFSRPAAVQEWRTPYRSNNRDRFEQRDNRVRPERGGERQQVERSKKGAKGRRRVSEWEENEDDDDYDDDVAQQRRRLKEDRKLERERQKQLELEAAPKTITLPQFISVLNLGAALGVRGDEFLGQLGELGFENISLESIMTGETAALVAQEYGFEPVVDAGEAEDLKPRPPPEDGSSLPLRPPVVTIMGHVDHGKTTLLDWLRKSSVAAQEHGGITQHIGAFSVRMSSGKQITFLDTPGHAAFLTMRQRGAEVTDIVVLVVAADDSVMPQTLEALRHARAAKVPIIVAINKIDKEDARPEQVKSDLARHGVELEDYGGDVPAVCVSGRTGQGMDALEETVLTLSDILDIRAETDGPAEGWVLESSVKPTGRVATVLVKRGTLRRGDFVVAGGVWTKVRAMRNEAGTEIDEAAPGTPIEILGWKDPPAAGDMVLQAPDEARAKAAVRWRLELREREKDVAEMLKQEEERRAREAEEAAAARAARAAGPAKANGSNRDNRSTGNKGYGGAVGEPEDSSADAEEAGPKLVNFIVKGDVHGSTEAVSAAMLELGNGEVQPRILGSGTGQINESDVEYAATAGAHIVNFNNPVPGNVKRMAEAAGVRILDHNVIYHLTDEVRDVLSDVLPPIISHRVLGEVEVLQVFKFNVRGRTYRNVAGCRVRNGVVTRNALCRVLRGGENVFEGTLDGLRQGKKDVAEMRKGTECGISFAEWEDFRVGDQIQVVEEVREKRKL